MSQQETLGHTEKRPDAELAQELRDQVLKDAARMRMQRAAFAAILLLAGVAFLVAGMSLLGFVAFGAALLFAVLFFDAIGHVREVKSRPWNSLAPRIPHTLDPKVAPPVRDIAEKQT